MKKTLIITLVLLIGISMLTGCGSASGGNGSAGVSGKTYSSGNFSVLVPDGWEEYPWTDSSGEITPEIVGVYNGAVEDYGRGLIRGLQISFPGKDTPKSFYTDPEDIESIEIGGHTWEGFITYIDYSANEVSPLTIIWTTIGDEILNVTGFAPKGERDKVTHIDLNDPEIIAIISSITPD